MKLMKLPLLKAARLRRVDLKLICGSFICLIIYAGHYDFKMSKGFDIHLKPLKLLETPLAAELFSNIDFNAETIK